SSSRRGISGSSWGGVTLAPGPGGSGAACPGTPLIQGSDTTKTRKTRANCFPIFSSMSGRLTLGSGRSTNRSDRCPRVGGDRRSDRLYHRQRTEELCTREARNGQKGQQRRQGLRRPPACCLRGGVAHCSAGGGRVRWAERPDEGAAPAEETNNGQRVEF